VRNSRRRFQIRSSRNCVQGGSSVLADIQHRGLPFSLWSGKCKMRHPQDGPLAGSIQRSRPSSAMRGSHPPGRWPRTTPLLLPSTRIPHNCASVTVRPQPSSDRLGISKSRVVWKMRRRSGWFGNNFTFGKLAANCLNCVVSFGVLGPTLHKNKGEVGPFPRA